jgi:glycosyltransferase involved in cell wall biosynthesis
MPNTPFFSIVIPTFNRSGPLVRALRSVFEQTCSDFEVIVVDDGSTDDTEAVVGAYRHPALRYHKATHGERGAARNVGARLARGRYVNFFDSDDLLYPHHLAEALAFIKANHDPAICHFAYEMRDTALNLIAGPHLGTDLNDRPVTGGGLAFNAAFLRRDIALSNPFSEDPELACWEDRDLWLRLGARFKILHSDTVTSIIVHHDSRSLTATPSDILVRRHERFLASAFEDEEVRRRYGSAERRLKAGAYCSMSLQLSLDRGPKLQAARYLLKAAITWPTVIATRPFHGAVKRFAMSLVPASRSITSPHTRE